VLQSVEESCRVLQSVAMCRIVMQCDAVCSSVLQCVAVSCSELQRLTLSSIRHAVHNAWGDRICMRGSHYPVYLNFWQCVAVCCSVV